MRVKIKTWDEMLADYGLDRSGHIDVDAGFTEDMESCMPADRIIEVIPRSTFNRYAWLPLFTNNRDFEKERRYTAFVISPDMVAEIISE